MLADSLQDCCRIELDNAAASRTINVAADAGRVERGERKV